MGKHSYEICFRCSKPAGRTQISVVYGCPACQKAMSPETKAQLHRLHIEKNRLAREALKDVGALQQARLEQSEVQAAKGEPLSEIARHRRASEPTAEALQERDEKNAVIAKIDAELTFLAAADRALAPFMELPRCTCCFTPWHASEKKPPYEETADGKLLCVPCAYGVLRTGYCGLHQNTLYPELKHIARIHPRDYPDGVLPPLTKAMFGG